MKQIDVGQGFFALIDDEDFDRVRAVKWWLVRDPNNFYAKRNLKVGTKWTTQTLHSFVLRVARGSRIDHKDHNGLNNQKNNLRPATQRQNCRNRRHTGNRFGFKGVFFDPRGRRHFGAAVRVGGKRIFAGYFATLEEAAMGYNQKAIEIFGEFAHLN